MLCGNMAGESGGCFEASMKAVGRERRRWEGEMVREYGQQDLWAEHSPWSRSWVATGERDGNVRAKGHSGWIQTLVRE